MILLAALLLGAADVAADSLEGLYASTALAALVARASTDPAGLAKEFHEFGMRTSVLQDWGAGEGKAVQSLASNSMPVVLAHGMGDSCFNAGFKSVTAHVASKLSTYATCIPTGDNAIEDTINGFLMNMDKSVDEFAKRVKADPKLASGFNAIGLSQGNTLIRGYIQKYNDPPVHTFLSVCGTNGGVAAFPQCSPKTPIIGSVCEALTSVLATRVQQARPVDPLPSQLLPRPREARHGRVQAVLATRPVERRGHRNATAARAHWSKTSKFVWVRGLKDTVVYPNIAEQWGALTADYPRNLTTMPMRSTPWYESDAFGLRTADLAGKHAFEEFDGEHIRFTTEELDGWLEKYFA